MVEEGENEGRGGGNGLSISAGGQLSTGLAGYAIDKRVNLSSGKFSITTSAD